MFASGLRKLALNSKAFALYQPRCNIPKRTFMNSIPGGSEGPLAGMTQSRFDQFYASMAENQEILGLMEKPKMQDIMAVASQEGPEAMKKLFCSDMADEKDMPEGLKKFLLDPEAVKLLQQLSKAIERCADK
mmetsp:Transcript_31617/g.30152  ORF Transcript_31617/g.30152 Transcript_31617/m.30152 type:complete len:132 (-) Transcript_31617:113-508(-)|eukprot:CAMPEP_0119033880 /NCGR_PEP_ID=MMETSP1177-20130426/954_1 /TAXON_ID=2985 /ORGANISM="Ochromonas sp, Strain CCMP1899" /LENGTH=131 /DNA_ID=CAMNT_0006990981 /DNA_START=54 /DNA_END=449 /DNA_ORIENTATION=+